MIGICFTILRKKLGLQQFRDKAFSSRLNYGQPPEMFPNTVPQINRKLNRGNHHVVKSRLPSTALAATSFLKSERTFFDDYFVCSSVQTRYRISRINGNLDYHKNYSRIYICRFLNAFKSDGIQKKLALSPNGPANFRFSQKKFKTAIS